MMFQFKKTASKPLGHASVKNNEWCRSAKGPCVFLGLRSQHVKPDMVYDNYTVFKVIVNAVL